MAAPRTLFSTRHVLVLSLALNTSLMLKINQEKSDTVENQSLMEKLEQRLIAEASPREAIQRVHFTAPQPHFSAVGSGDTPDDGESVVNLDHGDPTMYESYWQQMGDRTTVVIPGWQFTSYFSDASYPIATDCLKSSLFRWSDDAGAFDGNGPYIELVTSPNNPDGFVRNSVVNRSGGLLVHDLAYYWPHYTPITSPANHGISLFPVSKTTVHAGSRIGWALVKDPLIAKKMVKYIEVSTISVSKDSQIRSAKVLKVVPNVCEGAVGPDKVECFFRYSHSQMTRRWKLLREAVKESGIFSLPEFSPGCHNFLEQSFEALPAFSWLKCEGGREDCESFLRRYKILTRSGIHFGVGPSYVRVHSREDLEGPETGATWEGRNGSSSDAVALSWPHLYPCRIDRSV